MILYFERIYKSQEKFEHSICHHKISVNNVLNIKCKY